MLTDTQIKAIAASRTYIDDTNAMWLTDEDWRRLGEARVALHKARAARFATPEALAAGGAMQREYALWLGARG